MPLSAEELAQLDREGWVLGKGIIPTNLIESLQHEITDVIDGKAAELLAAGKLDDLHRDADFLTRLSLLYAQCPEVMTVVQGGRHAGKAMFQVHHLRKTPAK